MATYRVKVGCGNCCSKREYDIDRDIPIDEADLICPNCGCCPTDKDFVVFTKNKSYGKTTQVTESDKE